MKLIISSTLMMAGLILMAGSAGDCDGACGPGNTIGEMLMYAGAGLAMFATGALMAIAGDQQ